MKPWPKVELQLRNGDKVIGDVAHVQDSICTVRYTTKPKAIPGNYGLQIVDYIYQDFQNQYVKLL